MVGISYVGDPAVCSETTTGSYDLFIRGADNALWWRHYAGGWSAWQSLGGVLTASPAAEAAYKWSASTGRIDVFVRGTDGALWERATTDAGATWGAWTKIGGQLLEGTGPGVCSAQQYGVYTYIFVTGTNHQLYNYLLDTGGPWTSLGGYLTSSPAATSVNSGMTEVFVRGSDGDLWYRWC